ncbi:MAG TPA: 2,3-bisphosphoglycerate-dependent phosphoglycerate mutase [Candidatus Saccharimonadales bacterium]|jgi:2,3-bisphosphoglycerate-dependent phosphoglycerate mutase|nr:2,3-bisphosphoglycerate-dependent phosphoglycerate mutase [Candidatus Saccharimonadales bacterium]
MSEDIKTGLLVISRHTESEWNLLGKWTGLNDIDLTEKGHQEAEQIGELLKDLRFDVVYTSEQKRTHQTLAGILKGSVHPDVPHHIQGAVNERDYGDLTGKNKWEVQEEIGEEAFKGIRRGWDYPVPSGETLKDVYARVVPFFDTEILPQLKAGKNILLVAHGNSIRALIKHLDEIHEDRIADVEMSFGQILLYHIAPDGSVSHKEIRQIDIVPPKA